MEREKISLRTGIDRGGCRAHGIGPLQGRADPGSQGRGEVEASPSRRQGQGGEQAAAPPGTNTHKGKKKHLLSLSEGMDLGRQQGSSLRNRCFSAFLVWTGGLPGRKKESPSRRRVNTASAPGPDGQQGWAPGAG